MNNSHENSLKSFIVSLYGEATHAKIRLLEKMRKKCTQVESSIKFLKKCRDNKIIPTCVKISKKKDIWNSQKVLNKCSLILLNNLIKQCYFKLNDIKSEIIELHSFLTLTLETDHFSSIDKIISKQVEVHKSKVTNKHDTKFNSLICKNSNNSNNLTKNSSVNTVVNLSNKVLSDAENSILQKGLNYALTPSCIPIEKIICGVEECVRRNKINRVKAETIRQDVSGIIRRANPLNSNVSIAERKALNNLRKDKDILILPADKGNATVILNVADYITKLWTC
jgi:hypothetical protein